MTRALVLVMGAFPTMQQKALSNDEEERSSLHNSPLPQPLQSLLPRPQLRRELSTASCLSILKPTETRAMSGTSSCATVSVHLAVVCNRAMDKGKTMRRRALFTFLLGLTVFLFGRYPAQAEISLQFVPVSEQVTVGAPITIAIRISGLEDFAAPSLAAFDIIVNFDPTILEFSEVNYEDPILGNQLDLFGLGSSTITTSDVGSVNLFELSLDAPEDLNASQTGNFTLARVTFNALTAGVSVLSLTVNALSNASGSLLTTSASTGVVEVRPQGFVTIPGNSGFEADLVHSQWIATTPNKTYNVKAPMVNPVVLPKGASTSLQAPAGKNFIGVLNPKDQDISGKLVHTAVAGPFPIGTVFQVTVWANRGRLAGAKTALFETFPSEVLMQFFGWGAGSLPTINQNTDNWSRRPIMNSRVVFTNWASNGEWASQTFQFIADKELSYISLSIAGMNHKIASYVAFDIE